MTEDLLRRIADALDRLAPPQPAAVPADSPAYRWDGHRLAHAHFAPLPLDLLTGIDDQKATLVENGRRHARGFAAHDALLWGARGTGKSAVVKASIGALRAEGFPIALIEVAADALATLPALFGILAGWSRPIILFVDDLAFEGGTSDARLLRSLLDGGASARPPHVRLYVTSNRRHIVARDMAEQDSAINVRDVVDDRLALADRFGLSLGFHVADQSSYLTMVEGYCARLGLGFDPADAVQFATQRGARSGRVAWHYIVEIAGRAGKGIAFEAS